jgi:hypothetical protein
MSRKLTFSERNRLIPQPAVQLGSVDDRLRNGIWNTIYDLLLKNIAFQGYGQPYPIDLFDFWSLIWRKYFRFRIDEMPAEPSLLLRDIKAMYFDMPWHSIYDFVEAIYRECNHKEVRDLFLENINEVLKRDNSGYRMIDGIISAITSDQEIIEIERAIEYPESFSTHIRCALQLLSDKKNPDYRNSIKESISAVEALCFKASGLREFEKAIKALQSQIGLHGALRTGFMNLYGYTSNDQGIRHALMDEQNLDFEDAHFFMIACAAFVNYAQCKLAKITPSAKTR